MTAPLRVYEAALDDPEVEADLERYLRSGNPGDYRCGSSWPARSVPVCDLSLGHDCDCIHLGGDSVIRWDWLESYLARALDGNVYLVPKGASQRLQDDAALLATLASTGILTRAGAELLAAGHPAEWVRAWESSR